MAITTELHSDQAGADLHAMGRSQAGDPGAIGAFKGWQDTDDESIHIRNSTDTGWIDLATGSLALDYAEAGDLVGVAFGDTASAGVSTEVPRADHRHPAMADPVPAHAAAGDPHTGYRLESADHSHASTGLQGGTIAHSVTTGQTVNDHHNRDHAAAHAAAGADPLMDATAPSTQAFGDAAAAGAAAVAAKRDHKHAMPADPVTAHAAAGDPHTGYRLESADHSHASTGLQGGTLDHANLTNVTATQHHNNANDPTATEKLNFSVYCRKAADESKSATALADSTGMGFAVVAGTYLFEYHVYFDTNAATVGIRLSVNGPTKTSYIHGLLVPVAAPTAAGAAMGDAIAVNYDGEPQVWSAGPGSVGGYAILTGSVVITASGTLILRHGSETATATTIRAGSWGRLTRIA